MAGLTSYHGLVASLGVVPLDNLEQSSMRQGTGIAHDDSQPLVRDHSGAVAMGRMAHDDTWNALGDENTQEIRRILLGHAVVLQPPAIPQLNQVDFSPFLDQQDQQIPSPNEISLELHQDFMKEHALLVTRGCCCETPGQQWLLAVHA